MLEDSQTLRMTTNSGQCGEVTALMTGRLPERPHLAFLVAGPVIVPSVNGKADNVDRLEERR